jgi:high affinity sulfate transporter 1
MGGISVACLHFPQGLAYGLLASLTPVEGLYSSFFPILFYTIFGTSQHMSFATDSVIAILTAEVIDTQVKSSFLPKFNISVVHATHTMKTELLNYRIVVSAACTFVCGSVLVVMGIFRLGFLTSYQSKSFIGGFTFAAAFHIFTSQIPKGLGIEIPLVKGIGKLVYTFKFIFEDIRNTHVPSLIIVILCVIFIVFIKDFINERYKRKLRVPVPADLLTIIIATIISTYTNLEKKFGIEVVGSIPVGIPDPKLPDVSLYVEIFPECFQMALLIFFLSIAMAKVCAEQNEYEINDNKELMAYGLTNVGCSFFPCFPASVSPPRNMILSSMGAKTTLNGLFTTCVMLLVLYVLGQLFAQLPVPALAAMIFVSVKPLLLQVRSLPKLYRVNIYDMVIWIATCSSGILLDLPYGLLVGIGVSFITVVVQSQRTDTEVRYRTNDHIFMKKEHQPHISESSKVVVFHMCSALYFATSERFRRRIYESTLNPLKMKYKPVQEIEVTFSYSSSTNTESSASQKSNRTSQASDLQGPLKVIIIDCSAVTYIDIQGVNTLSVIFEEYRRAGITVYLAACTPYMWNCLKKSDFFNVVSLERVFFELEDAFYAANEVIT